MNRSSLVETTAWAAASLAWIAAASLLLTAVWSSDSGFSALLDGLTCRWSDFCSPWFGRSACGTVGAGWGVDGPYCAVAGAAKRATSAIALEAKSFIEKSPVPGGEVSL